jgi:hypothetical protein
MDRRAFLTGTGLALTAVLAGCMGDDEVSQDSPDDEVSQDSPENGDGDADEFLAEGETPESDGAREFLTTVAEVTDGRTGFHGNDDAPRIRFSEDGDTWTIKYYGDHVSGELLREQIGELSTAFTSHRPDGVSLEALVLHECTTAVWEVSADTAAAYEREELDRKEFVDRVFETLEKKNNC